MFEKQTGAPGNADSSTVLIFPLKLPQQQPEDLCRARGRTVPPLQHITGFLPRLLFANKKFSKWD